METESIQDKACHLNEGVCVYQCTIETEAKMKRAEASLNEVSSGVQGCITGNTVQLAIWACPWPGRKCSGWYTQAEGDMSSVGPSAVSVFSVNGKQRLQHLGGSSWRESRPSSAKLPYS